MTDHQRVSYGRIDTEYAMRLATTPPDEDGPVWMVNLMKYREVAAYDDGNPDGVSGREADDRYAPVEILREIGAEVVFFGDVDTQLLGDQPRWDRIGVVKYPTRRAFIEMQSRPDFRAKHEHKQAGMSETIVMGCQPAVVPPWPEGVPAPRVWSDVEHPPTTNDGAVMVLHVVKFAADGGARSMVDYQNHAAVIAGQHGGHVAGWFDVEGTIVGDGRSWDQARFNRFPSKAAFMAVVLDPDRLAAQRAHREPAMTDTYTMIVRPTIDRLGGSPS
jgi:hypothetical protein